MQLKFMKFYCMTSELVIRCYVECLQHHCMPKSEMRHSMLGRAESWGSFAPFFLEPDLHATQHGLVRNPAASQWKSGTNLYNNDTKQLFVKPRRRRNTDSF